MTVVSRADWNAVPPRSVTRLREENVRHFIVHHTTGNHELIRDTWGWVNRIQRDHIQNRGWSDIAYNFLVDASGAIFVGRGWHVVGAHTKDRNSSSIGVAFLGDGRLSLTDAAKRSIHDLYVEAQALYGDLNASVHGDWSATACPGQHVTNWVRQGLPLPAQPSPAPAPSGRPTVRRGSSGDAVRELQEKLFVDGVFGPNTEEAVRRFQHRYGLTVDGIVGPQTWAKLDEVT